MSDINEVLEQNEYAAAAVISKENGFDKDTAELVLRSIAVAADRLEPRQVSRLSMPAREALMEAASTARRIAPLSAEDRQRYPDESPVAYAYRTEVWQPLHRLQAVVANGDHAKDEATTGDIKIALWLGCVAFRKILTDPPAQSFPALQETVGDFGSNAQAASNRARLLSE